MISHAAVGAAAAAAIAPEGAPLFWPAAIVCSALPDADVVSFFFRAPYGHALGHRGFFHSLFFGGGVSALLTGFVFSGPGFPGPWLASFMFFFLLWASHGLLDTLTQGALGVSLLSPFVKKRYSCRWKPIPPSPITPQDFFSRWGLMVMKNEILWIWLPASLLVTACRLAQVGI